MRNLRHILLAIAVVSLIASFVGRHNPVVDGLGKALFGIFFSLFLIHRYFGEESTS